MRDLAIEGRVNRAIRRGRPTAQTFQVFNVASLHARTGGYQLFGRSIGACEPVTCSVVPGYRIEPKASLSTKCYIRLILSI